MFSMTILSEPVNFSKVFKISVTHKRGSATNVRTLRTLTNIETFLWIQAQWYTMLTLSWQQIRRILVNCDATLLVFLSVQLFMPIWSSFFLCVFAVLTGLTFLPTRVTTNYTTSCSLPSRKRVALLWSETSGTSRSHHLTITSHHPQIGSLSWGWEGGVVTELREAEMSSDCGLFIKPPALLNIFFYYYYWKGIFQLLITQTIY